MWDQSLRFTRSFIDYARSRLLSTFALVICASLLEGVGILFLLPVLQLLLNDDALQSSLFASTLSALGLNTPAQMICAVLAAFFCIMIVRAVTVAARDVRLTSLSLGFVDHCRTRLFSSLADTSWLKVLTTHRADIEHVLTMDVSRIAQGTTLILQAASRLVLLITQLTIALVLSPLMTVAVLAPIFAGAGLLWPIIGRARGSGDRLSKAGLEVMTLLNSFLSGLKLAKTHGTEDRYVSAFDENLSLMRGQMIAFVRQQTTISQTFQCLTAMVAAAAIYIGLIVLEQPLATVAIILIIMVRLTGPLRGTLSALQSFANMLPAFENYQRIIRQAAPEHNKGSQAIVDVPANLHAESRLNPAAIRLQNVSFRYGPFGDDILKNISLEVSSGELVAIVGASGAGKTTLVDLLCGLLAPTQGQVCVDGAPLNEEFRKAWRHQLSYVPQDPFLFDQSIRKNLLWAEAPRDDAALWEALRLAGADEFVRRLEHGLDTRVGERGAQMSGGERQRICLARALVRQPRLLILDEATNALDAHLEREIMETVGDMRGVATIIVVTHRPSALTTVDKVIRLAGGRQVGGNTDFRRLRDVDN